MEPSITALPVPADLDDEQAWTLRAVAGINVAFGFRPTGVCGMWQKRLA